ncbi:hypothetical protein SKAU_G00252440 [Synaphobranchus kaupii]|uniref:Uncharacterized protein n=1 Tax=Synaphobranchus kaupii TaxID=118154 RepID=A0A9Q1F342_SYNKA|nr:hypothetical protein SKAU_G00252440 [Synaphobranchus kaupii]
MSPSPAIPPPSSLAVSVRRGGLYCDASWRLSSVRHMHIGDCFQRCSDDSQTQGSEISSRTDKHILTPPYPPGPASWARF